MITLKKPNETNAHNCIAVVVDTKHFTEYTADVVEIHGSREGYYAVRCIADRFSYSVTLSHQQLVNLYTSLWLFYKDLPASDKSDILGERIVAVLGRMHNDIMRNN